MNNKVKQHQADKIKSDSQKKISQELMTVLGKFEKHINYQFHNIDLLRLALTHRSLTSDSNERLEFLGDATFNLVISDYLYTKYPNSREGMLSRIRARIVNKASLQKIAAKISIRDFIRVGLAENKNIANTSMRTSIISDAVEAIIGAVYVDGGFAAARSVVIHIFNDELSAIDITDVFKDHKTLLQEIIQSNYHSVPEYILKKEKRLASNTREFIVQCVVPNREEKFSGKGASRKEAEQEAARATLQGLYGSLL